MQSIFTDKTKQPTAKDLEKALGPTYPLWQSIAAFTHRAYPGARENWNFPGAKYGWSFRISDKKRVLVYLLPRDCHFKAALVFGPKAYEAILDSDVADSIKEELRNTKIYAEGRGIRIDVKNKKVLKDVEKLITIKISH